MCLSSFIWKESSPWKKLRVNAHVSRKRLSKVLGVSVRYINYLESGNRQFNSTQVMKYASECDYDPVLFLAEIERWMALDPTNKKDTATRIAKKIHVGNNPLRKRREAMGMNAQEFSEAVGCDRFCVYKTENGITKPQVMTLNRFAEILGVNPDILKGELVEWKNIMDTKDPYQIIEDGLKEEKESNATQ